MMRATSRDDPLLIASDGSTVEELYERLAPELWRSVYVYVGGRRALADDVVAESFVRLIAYLGRVREPRSWLFVTAFRLAAQELRREARHRELAEADAPIDPEAGLAGLADILRALEALSPRQRAAVALHYQAGLSVTEIAAVLGVSDPTVRVHLYLARRRLRDSLGGGREDESSR